MSGQVNRNAFEEDDVITSIGSMFIKPGSERLALGALKNLVKKVRLETGTLVYLVHTPAAKGPSLPPGSPNEVIFYEVYRDKKALQSHLDGAFKGFCAKHKALFLTTPGGEIFVQFASVNRLAGFIGS